MYENLIESLYPIDMFETIFTYFEIIKNKELQPKYLH